MGGMAPPSLGLVTFELPCSCVGWNGTGFLCCGRIVALAHQTHVVGCGVSPSLEMERMDGYILNTSGCGTAVACL
jgi:hypothetical protein